MGSPSIQQKFTEALDALVAQIKEDRSVLAAILCGSLSHDTVWAKSDIDLVLVTIDDKKVDRADLAIYANGVNVHAFLLPRTEFRKSVEGRVRNSFMHSFLAKGRLLYTHDPTIADLCTRLHEIGARDTQVQLLRAATSALPPIDKAHKWFITRGDLDYTALWILYAATPLEARSCTEIEDHFKRNFDVGGVTLACEYLADQGLIGKAGVQARLTKKSNIAVQELAFFSMEDRRHGLESGGEAEW
jgi:predicted nucleotidyltransferase